MILEQILLLTVKICHQNVHSICQKVKIIKSKIEKKDLKLTVVVKEDLVHCAKVVIMKINIGTKIRMSFMQKRIDMSAINVIIWQKISKIISCQ